MLLTQKGFSMDELKEEIKKVIISSLQLEDIKPENIVDSEPLFGEGLGLDSIDALEIIVLLEKNYGIRLANASEGKEIFKSVRTIAAYVAANRKK